KHPMSSDIATAYDQGRAAATVSAQSAAALGILPGSAIYSDIEAFSPFDVGCAQAVRSYVSGWTFKLHRSCYLAGVYSSLVSGVRRLSASHTSTAFARPDVMWSAQWDGKTSLRDWTDVPNEQWPAGQRIKQYQGSHNEAYGGATLNVDSNAIDAPVATIAAPSS